MSTLQLCSFQVADMLFGVEVLNVQEVLRYQPLTRVPLAPTAVVGLINLRGHIVTAVDMRTLLALGTREGDEPAMNVVLRRDDGIISLLVDSIGDVFEVEEARLEPPPETLDAKTRNIVRSICKLDRELLLLLDSTKVTGHSLRTAA